MIGRYGAIVPRLRGVSVVGSLEIAERIHRAILFVVKGRDISM